MGINSKTLGNSWEAQASHALSYSAKPNITLDKPVITKTEKNLNRFKKTMEKIRPWLKKPFRIVHKYQPWERG